MTYVRWQKEPLIQALKTRRVILLNGARQCGKTTLAKELATSTTEYRTLDQVSLREIALSDPHGFVEHTGKTLIIDEVQRAPDLLSAIKLKVDKDTRPGQYLLTGSAKIETLPSVQESLAGRIRKIRLRTLTQGEILKTKPVFIDNAFKKIFPNTQSIYERKKILEMAFRGGYPEPLHFDHKDRRHWHLDYLNALLERDLKDITHIVRQAAMEELIKIAASWSSKLMDISAIGAGLSIRRATVESYLNALESLYLIERVQPWTHTDYDRVGKKTKLFMCDSGLMSSILRWNFSKIEFDPDRSGKLLETFMFNEIAAQVEASQSDYRLYHYRDREKREIDFMIERDDSALLGIEIKAGSVINSEDFKHLKWLRENISKDRLFIGIVLYSGELVSSMGNNLWAVPFGGLWG